MNRCNDIGCRGLVIEHGYYSKDYFARQRAKVAEVCKPSNPEPQPSLLRRWAQRFRRGG